MNHELTNIEKVRSLLLAYGIPASFEVEEEAVGMILAALNQEDLADVRLDEEGGLIIEFNGNE